ncbi:hypothetical protein SAY87_021495 [Trapa incisa]|uniref:Stigma-specific STIG1-like protein 1 n=2 Tax=Trapa TaxID=22665 RepID=A0AAN7MH62_TRANT|nr:hypothetical protein SAY87_021495 [Trapa incisa]KAK4803651.1 hypothetical protein SAY86_003468 [Trapa natans]
MKFNRTFFLFFLAALLTLSAASSIFDEDHNYYSHDQPEEDNIANYDKGGEDEKLPEGRFLASHHKARRRHHRSKAAPRNNCRRFLGGCRSARSGRRRGGPWLRCCRGRCVDLIVNRYNCGACGRKCKYGEICCGGKCVNPLANSRHCGGCFKGCAVGNGCAFGFCNYA